MAGRSPSSNTSKKRFNSDSVLYEVLCQTGAETASGVLLLDGGEESALHPKIGGVTKNRANSGLSLIEGGNANETSRAHFCAYDTNGE